MFLVFPPPPKSLSPKSKKPPTSKMNTAVLHYRRKTSGWCSVIYPSLFLPPRLTVPVFRRLPAYSRVTVYRQGRYRRKMKHRLPSRNYRHIYYRLTELPSDLCFPVYRQINTGNCRYRQESTANTGYRPKRTVSSLLYWMPRDMWRMFFYILYFLVRRFHWFPDVRAAEQAHVDEVRELDAAKAQARARVAKSAQKSAVAQLERANMVVEIA